MSYCRWSTDGFRCDLYCYEDVAGGYTTHVAENRLVNPPPEIAWPGQDADAKAWIEFTRMYNEAIQKAIKGQYEAIALPHAGERFNDPTLQEFKDRLLYLRGLGYRFPDEVLSEIDEELKEKQE